MNKCHSVLVFNVNLIKHLGVTNGKKKKHLTMMHRFDQNMCNCFPLADWYCTHFVAGLFSDTEG